MTTDAAEQPKPQNNRQAPRINHKLNVELRFPENTHNYQTHDISYVGVFIECPEPLPLRKLVRLSTTLPDAEEPIELIGVVAHRINATDAIETGRPTGMGLQLFGSSKSTRDTWRAFVHAEYEKDPTAFEEVQRLELPCLKVRFPNTEEMQNFATRHVARGEVFIRSADLYPPNAQILLEAIHPESGQSQFVEATVIELVEAPRHNRGMRISFPDPETSSQVIADFAQ